MKLCDCEDHTDHYELCSTVSGHYNCSGKYIMPELPEGTICKVVSDEIEIAGERFYFLCKNMPRRCGCGCDSEQIQLISSLKPARWKCRKCHNEWTFEPETG